MRLGFEYRIAFVARMAITMAVPRLIVTAATRTKIDPHAPAVLSLATIAATALVASFLWRGWQTPLFLTNIRSRSGRWRLCCG